MQGTPDEVKANKEVQEAYFGKGIIAGEAVKFMLNVDIFQSITDISQRLQTSASTWRRVRLSH